MTMTITGQIPRRGDQLIDFSASNPDGERLSTRDFYMRRNLALAFTHGPSCDACRKLLRGMARQEAAARAEVGALLAVVPSDRAMLARLRDELDLSFPLAADPDLALHRRYGLVTPDGGALAAIFVADRYGTIFETSVADAAHRMLAAEEIPGWLEFIACRCS